MVPSTLRALRVGEGAPRAFQIDDERREALLNGWNETARIRAMFADSVTRFEEDQQRRAPWLWGVGD